jgi:hypothetical protein
MGFLFALKDRLFRIVFPMANPNRQSLILSLCSFAPTLSLLSTHAVFAASA